VRHRSTEQVEHHACPEHVAERLRVAGGVNRFGGPMFRVVWGYDRIVPITGLWQEFEQFKVSVTAIPKDVPAAQGEPVVYVPPNAGFQAGDSAETVMTRLKSSVVETRYVPKYLPGNCWHLEMWRPPEEYGTREQWGKLGEEIIGTMTVDTAGPYPEMGEYELCFPLTHDGTVDGQVIPLEETAVEGLVQLIVASRDRFTYQQRRAAIEQEFVRQEDGFVRIAQDQLKDGLRPYAGEKFVIKL